METRAMNLGTLLRTSANGYMAATLATRVTGDVVRRLPYPAVGLAALVGALAGAVLNRRHSNARR